MIMADYEWTAEADSAMTKVPFFVRRMARRAVEQAAAADGVKRIDLALVNRVRDASKRRRDGASK